MDKQAVVIDNDTNYTKMGYAGNIDPDFIIPTAILDKKSTLGVSTNNDKYDYLSENKRLTKPNIQKTQIDLSDARWYN